MAMERVRRREDEADPEWPRRGPPLRYGSEYAASRALRALAWVRQSRTFG